MSTQSDFLSPVITDFRVRSQRANLRRGPVANLSIEREAVSIFTVASRLEVSESIARAILSACQRKPGAVTWARLTAERDRRAERRRL
jgi:hypothetical protein